MDLAERLRERLKREFGIESAEEVEEALEAEDLDLGIFVSKIDGGTRNAS